MSTTSKYRGNLIIYKDNQWIFEDTGLSVKKTHKDKPCGNCGKLSTPEGHDACLGTLIGIMNACCGHGEEKEAYVQFLDGECIRGKDAIDVMRILKKYS